MEKKNVAIACQGGGSHAAYAAGALKELLPVIGSNQRDELRLVGISGTSGGAICALLAWYGMLEGGPEKAIEKLDAFWQRNCAALVGERFSNELAMLALESLPFEIQFSPYVPPLSQILWATTKLWPDVAKLAGAGNQWIRGDYYQLGELISRDLDFRVIEALGRFCSIPGDIRKWIEYDLTRDLTRILPARDVDAASKMQQLQDRIRHHLTMPALIAELLPESAPLRSILKSWRHEEVSFDEESLSALSSRVSRATTDIPQLLIGAVEVGSGDFATFSSERAPDDGGITLDSVLASAAIPWLFEAVSIGKNKYWDGLFSQNPPIRNFTAGLQDTSKKPDEIWVVQINPTEYEGKDISQDIWNRRNELAGNLSLNQELSFIEAINDLLHEHSGHVQDRKYIQVDRIKLQIPVIEEATGIQIGALSKLDRSERLKNALMQHGGKQAKRFLRLRADRPQVIATLRKALTDAGIQAATPALIPSLGNSHQVSLFVDEIYSGEEVEGGNGAIQATWHGRAVTADSHRLLTLEGKLEYATKNGAPAAHIRDVKVTNVRRLKKPSPSPGGTSAENQAPRTKGGALRARRSVPVRPN